eukprot:COSAG06_NODE_1319_length_9879_cov_11.837014_3_plen_75_part_00
MKTESERRFCRLYFLTCCQAASAAFTAFEGANRFGKIARRIEALREDRFVSDTVSFQLFLICVPSLSWQKVVYQ